MKLTWKRKQGLYQSGENLYLGAWIVGSVGWSPTSRSGQNYEVCCHLPGIRDHLPWSDSQDEAKRTLEKAVQHWLSKIDGEAS
ncbi:MAG: hypothetical protein [Bacteriophage sp.]|nr:MAG: hypothetical protein [Bacteriophage sp.]